MQYGTVPICASTGGLVDTVKEGVTGFHMGALDPDVLLIDDVEAVGATMSRAAQVRGEEREGGGGATRGCRMDGLFSPYCPSCFSVKLLPVPPCPPAGLQHPPVQGDGEELHQPGPVLGKARPQVGGTV